MAKSYVRHVLGLRFTAELVWKIFLTAQGVLQLSRFPDELFGQVSTQSFVNIDQENRSRLILHFGREIDDHWSVGARYSVYVNESAATSGGETIPSFFRQTIFFWRAIRIRWSAGIDALARGRLLGFLLVSSGVA